VPEERASANAWTSFTQALGITISGEATQTVHVSRSALTGTARAAHTVIEAKPQSSALVILHSTGQANLTENVEIIVGDAANLTVVSVQQWDDDGSVVMRV
jgi:Fe-S cluster assembly protein SufD